MPVEFRIRRETVEVWFQDQLRAVLDRDLFRTWLTRNPGPYVVDDIIWTMADLGQAVLIIRDFGSWLIPVDLMLGLYARVCGSM